MLITDKHSQNKPCNVIVEPCSSRLPPAVYAPSLKVLFTGNHFMVDQSQPDTTRSLNRVEEEVKGPAVERQLQPVLTHQGASMSPLEEQALWGEEVQPEFLIKALKLQADAAVMKSNTKMNEVKIYMYVLDKMQAFLQKYICISCTILQEQAVRLIPLKCLYPEWGNSRWWV